MHVCALLEKPEKQEQRNNYFIRHSKMSTVERKDDFKGETGHVEYTSEAHVPAAVEEEEVELSRSALIRTWLVIFVSRFASIIEQHYSNQEAYQCDNTFWAGYLHLERSAVIQSAGHIRCKYPPRWHGARSWV